MIRKLMIAGADAFRINMSHGDQKTKAKLVEHIRALEKEFHRPTTILFDLQGPKLRVGHFAGGKTVLEKGQRFILDRQGKAGDSSRVQLPEDVAEARALIGERAALLAKIEKPAAIDQLNDIVALADAVMVARGDLGVELPPEQVPPLQNKIVACARQFGKPVVVATQ